MKTEFAAVEETVHQIAFWISEQDAVIQMQIFGAIVFEMAALIRREGQRRRDQEKKT